MWRGAHVTSQLFAFSWQKSAPPSDRAHRHAKLTEKNRCCFIPSPQTVSMTYICNKVLCCSKIRKRGKLSLWIGFRIHTKLPLILSMACDIHCSWPVYISYNSAPDFDLTDMNPGVSPTDFICRHLLHAWVRLAKCFHVSLLSSL